MPDTGQAIALATLEALYQQRYQKAVIRSAPLFIELELPELEPPEPCYDGDWLAPTMRKRVHDAAREGLITHTDVTLIESAQMILSTRLRSGGRTDVVVTATLNATGPQVTAARARATLLSKVNRAPTLPVVIAIDPDQDALQASNGTQDLLRKPTATEHLPPLQDRQAGAQARCLHLDPGLEFYEIAKTLLRLSRQD